MNRIYNGVIRENPVLVLLLGLCPALAVTDKARNGLAMGLIVTVILTLSNLILSSLRDVLPKEARPPVRFLTLAALVTVVELLAEAYCNPIHEALGVYLPLTAINLLLLHRAETFAERNAPLQSALDGIGMGLGFTLALTVAGILREFLGSGTVFGVQAIRADISPIGIFAQAPGAFLILALLIAAMRGGEFGERREKWAFPSEQEGEEGDET